MGGTLAQTTPGVGWHVIIPWLLTIVFGAATAILGVFNYRRSRFGAVKLINSKVYGEQSQEHPKGAVLWHIDLLSFGADIYDLQAFLELRDGDRKRHAHFTPHGKMPNPVKNGQGVTLRLSHGFLDQDDFNLELTGQPPRPKLHTLPPSDVELCIYGGGRMMLLKRIPGSKLRPMLEQFEKDHWTGITITDH